MLIIAEAAMMISGRFGLSRACTGHQIPLTSASLHAEVLARLPVRTHIDRRCCHRYPEKLSVLADAGYSNGEQAAELEAQAIWPYVPAHRGINNQGDGSLLDRTAFDYHCADDTLTCPAGRTLTRKQLQREKQLVIYQARAEDCSRCPLKPGCTKGSMRYVSRHVHEAVLERMHARATPEAMRRRRCTVEHPFAGLKYRIFEQPRFLLRGIAGASAEIAIGTLVWNLKRAIRVLGAGALQQQLAAA